MKFIFFIAAIAAGALFVLANKDGNDVLATQALIASFGSAILTAIYARY
jgi:hypothetical protein